MRTKHFTEDNRAEEIEGAQACLAALREIEVAANEAEHPEAAWREYWQAQGAGADILARAAGVTSPHATGFMEALGEYVAFCTSQGTPNLEAGRWIPRAAMTAAEFAARRRRMEADSPDGQ